MNARWAMIAVVGILVVDAYGGDWAHAGFLGTPRSGADWYALVPELGLMAWFEKKRWDSFLESGPVSTGFLGQAPFDPLKQGNAKMAEREIKNGRLAMLAVIGFFSQYAVGGCVIYDGKLGLRLFPTPAKPRAAPRPRGMRCTSPRRPAPRSARPGSA